MTEVCVHGHYYQPPRVDPWTGVIAPQPSAAPFRDWNHRIASECYAPSGAARLLGPDGRTRSVRNTYASMSFDIGPTLLNWLERERPIVLDALREADRESAAVFGRGSAMAQPYHHPILPLCDDIDRRTEVRWGLAAFERVFGRMADGMWLSETAVDVPTLETVAAEGVSFVILAPHQIASVRAPGESSWREVSEPEVANRAFVVGLPSGRSILAVAYDATVSHQIAFDGLLENGDRLAERLVEASHKTGLVCVATDGESYGHHHRFGEMALAYAQERIEASPDCRLTNMASWLERHPPTAHARVREPSSWSCAHGVGRWMEDCGCRMDHQRGWHQGWRGPLRSALNGLRDEARHALSGSGQALFDDPQAARDDYGLVVDTPEAFPSWYSTREGADPDVHRAHQWLEIQRLLLGMFTSCAWFFDEVTGIEPLQNIRLAAASIAKIRTLCGVDLEPAFRASLERIPSNLGTDPLLEVLKASLSCHRSEAAGPKNGPLGARRAGVLHAVSALDGSGPVGDLDGAVPFVDWLAEAGMSLWQVLPLVPVDGHGSPYSTWSTLSGNPDLVGLQWCIEAGLLPSGTSLPRSEKVDYREAAASKRALIIAAGRCLLDRPSHPLHRPLQDFIASAAWAREAALFRALKTASGGAEWWDWPDDLRTRTPAALEKARAVHARRIDEWCAALFLFERQWSEVRRYAESRGIRVVGDVPIYVGHDSVDVWANQRLFQLDTTGRLTHVAGVPPDAYSETGQLWGNPLYNWDAMAAEGHQWWVDRVGRLLEHCDAVRIDHFIGLSRYWSVSAEEETAVNGAWIPGPGRRFFDDLERGLGPLPLIAEDLGSVDEGTIALRDGLGLPGMRVLLFGLTGSSNEVHHPRNYPDNCVAYSSTHDSPTALGWWQSLTDLERNNTGIGGPAEAVAETFVDMILSSSARWAIIPLQDILGLGDDARMNRPGTMDGNWAWRQPSGLRLENIAPALRARIQNADRLSTEGPQ